MIEVGLLFSASVNAYLIHLLYPVTELLSNLHSEVFDVTGHEPVQTIYLGTKDKKPKPLITMPHGGPHAATPSTFSVDCVALALCGCKSLSLTDFDFLG